MIVVANQFSQSRAIWERVVHPSSHVPFWPLNFPLFKIYKYSPATNEATNFLKETFFIYVPETQWSDEFPKLPIKIYHNNGTVEIGASISAFQIQHPNEPKVFLVIHSIIFILVFEKLDIYAFNTEISNFY